MITGRRIHDHRPQDTWSAAAGYMISGRRIDVHGSHASFSVAWSPIFDISISLTKRGIFSFWEKKSRLIFFQPNTPAFLKIAKIRQVCDLARYHQYIHIYIYIYLLWLMKFEESIFWFRTVTCLTSESLRTLTLISPMLVVASQRYALHIIRQ